jgi:hypothetical protein
MSTVQTKIAAAAGCAADHRGVYYRFRQFQLGALYSESNPTAELTADTISSQRQAFIAAVAADAAKSEFEAALEVTLVLRHVKALFEATDFDALTAAAARHKAAGTSKSPAGLVLIIGHWTGETVSKRG